MWFPIIEDGKVVSMNKSQPALIEVAAEGHCSLLLKFETGEMRRLDVTPFVKRGGAYERLGDDEYLRLASVIDDGMSVGWPGGQEIYPEALYEDSVLVG